MLQGKILYKNAWGDTETLNMKSLPKIESGMVGNREGDKQETSKAPDGAMGEKQTVSWKYSR